MEERVKFDPSKYLKPLKGGHYLEVKYRLLWLRTEYPEAKIETELKEFGPDFAVFKATVELPNGAKATGWGMDRKSDFDDFLERAECISLDCPILTRDGWKTYDQVQPGEEVLAYDPERDQTVWTPLLAVTVYETPLPVLHLRNSYGFEARVTPEHTWAVYASGTYRHKIAPYKPVRRLIPTNQLKTHHRIITAAPCPEGFLEIGERDAAILGWLVTDGMIWRGDGTLAPRIYQSKPERVAELQELLGPVASERVWEPRERDFGDYVSPCLPQHVWALRKGYVAGLLEATDLRSYSDLVRVVTRLKPEARAAMLEAMLKADGSKDNVFGKLRPGVQEAFQILGALEGRSTGTLRRRIMRNGNEFFEQSLRKSRQVWVQALEIEPGDPEPVWCPTTAYGTWVTRLPSGFVTITGNTRALGRALAALGFGTQFAPEISEGDHIADSPVERVRGRSYGSYRS